MVKYLVKDLKKSAKLESLNLKGEAASSPLKPASGYLDLTSAQGRKAVFTPAENSPKQRQQMESINPVIPRSKYFYLPAERLPAPAQINRFLGTLKFATFGLLIAFTLNIFNVWTNGYQLKSTLISQASSGVGDILSAAQLAQHRNFSDAENSFDQAKRNFEQSLEKISFLQAAQSPDWANEKNSSSVSHFLLAGQHIAASGKLFAQAADDLQNLPSLFIQSNQDFLQKKQQSRPDGQPLQPTQADPDSLKISLTDKLKADLDKVNQAILSLQKAQNELNQSNPDLLPEKYRQELPALEKKLLTINQFLDQLRQNFPAILNLLGDRYPHRYAILLQNDSEIRPTGGFIGSLIILDLNEGNISRFDFHDVYQYDGQLLEKITPPDDIAKVADSWYLRDSNYSPDFALSAEKAAWFLQKSKGPSVDSVIAINQSALNDLLQLTGPIEVPELKSSLNAQNFQFVLSYLIESKFYGKTQPKIILQKTIQAFQKKLLQLNHWDQLFTLLAKESLDQKILFYSRDSQVQQFFEFLHLTPHQQKLAEKEDYLQVVASSIGGNKSDVFLEQELNHQTFVQDDGSLIDELTITRKHTWDLSVLEKWQSIIKEFDFNQPSEGLLDLLGRGRNKVSLKVYLPLGSTLENVIGLDQSQVSLRSDAELQKSYLLFTMETPLNQPSQVTFRYKLPYQLKLLPADLYRFTAQAQPGQSSTTIQHQINLPPQYNLIRQTAPALDPHLKQLYQSLAVVSL